MVCTIAGKQWPQEPLCVGDHQSFTQEGAEGKGAEVPGQTCPRKRPATQPDQSPGLLGRFPCPELAPFLTPGVRCWSTSTLGPHIAAPLYHKISAYTYVTWTFRIGIANPDQDCKIEAGSIWLPEQTIQDGESNYPNPEL